MKYQSSKQKLNLMHEALDRQLEMIINPNATKMGNKQKQNLRYIPDVPNQFKISGETKRHNYNVDIKQPANKSNKHQINDLERKIMELERKMDDIDVSSNDSVQIKVKNQLNKNKDKARIKAKAVQQKQFTQNTDRLLIGHQQKIKDQSRNKHKLILYSMTSEEEEDSQDYFQIQRQIDRRKQNLKLTNQQTLPLNRLLPLLKQKQNQPLVKTQQNNKKNREQALNLLKSRPQQKTSSAQKLSIAKSIKSVRDSVASRTSVQKNKQSVLKHENSKKSIKSSASQSKRRSNLSEKQISFNSYSQKQNNMHNEQVQMEKQLKKTENLAKQLLHYKRLAKKCKQQLDDYKIMQIQFKQMKKNFAKSQLIRMQQKKIIQALKNKMK